MKKEKISSFQIARLYIYIYLIILFVIILNFNKIKCEGCILCGLTTAFYYMFKFKLSKAIECNKLIVYFIPVMIIFIFDIFNVFYKIWNNFKEL